MNPFFLYSSHHGTLINVNLCGTFVYVVKCDVTVTSEGLDKLAYARYAWPEQGESFIMQQLL